MTKIFSSPGRRMSPVLLAGILVITGCRREEMASYRVPKERSKPDPSATADMPALPRGHIDWTSLPAGWEERPVSGSMRVANFVVAGDDGQSAELTVIPLPALAGREMEFVNMWREQVQLPHADTNEIAAMRQDINVAGLDGQLYDMAGEGGATPAGGPGRQRIVVAMATQEGMTWFFKMTGEDALVAREKPNLIRFLENIQLHQEMEGSDPHAGLGLAAGRQGAAAAVGTETTAPAFLPTGWTPVAPGPMLTAKFELPGGGVQVTVSSAGGDLLSNVNRWRGQLQLTPVGASELPSITTNLAVGATQATLVDMEGGGQRMIAVIVPRGEQSLFYKAMGAAEAVAREKDAFLAFAKEAQY